MMEGETAALQQMPEHVRKLLGAYEGLRGYHMLPEAGGGDAAPQGALRSGDEATGVRTRRRS